MKIQELCDVMEGAADKLYYAREQLRMYLLGDCNFDELVEELDDTASCTGTAHLAIIDWLVEND